MKAKLGRMLADVSYANYPGPKCAPKGTVVIVVKATNMPVSAGIDYFVARVDNPGYSIGVTASEFEELTDCTVCDVCDHLSASDICSDCKD